MDVAALDTHTHNTRMLILYTIPDATERSVKTELLVQINGVGSGEKSDIENNRVMVLAATNLPWQIDEAMRRRLTKRVCMTLDMLKASLYIYIYRQSDR